ncbi:MAG: DUF2914 domain-containing protein [Candidatus Thiodiazotropha sp.]
MSRFNYGIFQPLRWIHIPILLLFTQHLPAEELKTSLAPDAVVARALFTTNVVKREPVDQVVSAGEDLQSIYFFTDLRNLQGRVITHRWEFEGEFVRDVKFQVGGPHWRVYSKKMLNSGLAGKWTVMVLDESGWPLHASILTQEAPAE